MADRPKRDPYGGFPAFLARVSGNDESVIPPQRRATRPLWLVRALWGAEFARRAADMPPRWWPVRTPPDERSSG